MWLALRFVHWPLDARREIRDTRARLVIAHVRQRQQVVAACPKALAAGIRRGMDLADARLRCSDVRVDERQIAPERAALARLAGWAWGYSDRVHWAVAGPNIECSRLVLEIGASLRLFGGRERLLSSVSEDLAQLAYRYRSGIGDSPEAALAFARAGRRTRRRGDLGQLPIACLALESSVQTTLEASGIRRTDALLALPPATLARRFGKPLLEDLERLRGRRPHGLSLYRLPPRYDTYHELFGAIENTQGLVFVLRRVFDELALFLRSADSAIQTLRLALVHEDETTTPLVLKLSAPTSDARHLERVAQERLARVVLTAPVLAITVKSDRLRRSAHAQARFWSESQDMPREADWANVLDRIRARLGHEAITWIARCPEHRPDRASRSVDRPTIADPVAAGPDVPPRPLWLIEPPEPIPQREARVFQWISGPERIESGWWDTGQRRDYYRVLDESQRLLWIFRDLNGGRDRQARFYLHGLFG